MLPALLLAALPGAPPAAADMKLPAGFTATLHADNPLAPDCYTFTFDSAGRVLVAGKGYVRALEDADGDGVADRAVDILTDLKQGPMGLLAEGDSLFVVADGGLKRYRGYTGKDKLVGPPETLLALKTGGEHDAHAVRRGSDGWLYVLCGNMAGVTRDTIRGERSPVRDPIAGALVRLSPDFKQVEVVADGFRNPYSFDFDTNGEPFTFDSDNERCVGLPWYEGCRFYHVVPSGNYGWRSPQLSQTWRKPPYFPDVVQPVCDTGRGSPTGVACYRHTAFPERFRGGFFIADWTFGKVYFVPLKPKGASYTGKPEVFLEPTGTSGFAPTAVEVHPKTGELFVSIGGRGTRGGVYRIAADQPNPKAASIAMAKRTLDWVENNNWLESAKTGDTRARREALELIVRWWDKLPWGAKYSAAVVPNLAHEDRLVRQLAGRAGNKWFVNLGEIKGDQARLTLAFEQVREEPGVAFDTAIAVLEAGGVKPQQQLEALRLLQLVGGDLTARAAVGTAREGYTLRLGVRGEWVPRAERAIAGALKPYEDTAEPRFVKLEAARTLGALNGRDHRAVIDATVYAINVTTDYADDLHYLFALAESRQPETPDLAGVAKRLLGAVDKAHKARVTTDRHWPLRLGELAAALAKPSSAFVPELLDAPGFGRPEHFPLVRRLGPTNQLAAKFADRAEKDNDYAWTPAVVDLIANLPEPRRSNLARELYDKPGLEDAAVRILFVEAAGKDRAKFAAALKSNDALIVRGGARSLAQFMQPTGEEAVLAIRALRRFTDAKADAGVRGELVTLLQKASGEKIGADERAWSAWATKAHPEAAKALTITDGFDAAAWAKRASAIDFAKGDAERGRAAFTKATCAACHDGGGAVGPALAGIGKRFGRDDLLTSIVQPSKNVPARYRPTRVTTTDERTFTGVVIYEAADGVILQTGADTTVRIAGADIVSKKQVDVSLMPAGLLDKLSDAEIADLMAYLGKL